MSASDDLADLLEEADANTWDKTSPVPSWWKIADAVIAAGWQAPAPKIETAEELESLADDTLLLVVRSGGNLVYEMDGGQAWRFGYGYGDELHPDQLPATVLWEPGDDDE